MGTGKSAIGRQVARKLDLQFLDADHEIEQKAGQTISEIFASKGEGHFRRLEREFIDDGHPAEGCLVACGGGLIMQEGMIDLIRSKGVLVCLFASAETILERTSGNQKRPLLNVDDPLEKIRTLMDERMPTYKRAGTGILTDKRTIPDITEHVIRVYRKESRRFGKQG